MWGDVSLGASSVGVETTAWRFLNKLGIKLLCVPM